MFKVSILIIGTEIVKGITQDVNSYWISKFLSTHGFSVNMIITVDDVPNKIEHEFDKLWHENNLVIVTGGLGPTKDDMTKSVFAKIFNVNLKTNNKAKEIVQSNFKRFNTEWDDSNNYNFIPEGFTPLNNPTGLAPAFYLHKINKELILLPGVPREVQSICTETLPQLLQKNIQEFSEIVTIKTFGISEEKIFFELCPMLWEQLSKIGNVCCLPIVGGVNILVTTNNPNKREVIHKLIESSKLQQFVWQFGEKTLPEYIVQRALDKKITFSFAESCTGGLAASLITDVSGCSDVFMGSAVTYSNDSKINVLGVRSETITNHGAVSLEVAKEMSQGSIKKFNSDLAVSFSGIAGPSGGTVDKPVGCVAISWASNMNKYEKMYYFKGDRETLKHRFAMQGLFQLLDLIEKSSSED